MLLYRFLGFVGWLLDIYTWIIIAAALISWVSPDPSNPIVRFLRLVTEPVLRPIRAFLPNFGGIDVSPIILILVLLFLRRLILYDIAPNLL